MELINFPTVALGAALVSLIGVTLYAISQRARLRSRDEQLVVARAQARSMPIGCSLVAGRLPKVS